MLEHVPEDKRPALPSRVADHPNVGKPPLHIIGGDSIVHNNVVVSHDVGPPDSAAPNHDRWPPEAADKDPQTQGVKP